MPGLAQSISTALIDGVSPSAFEGYLDSDLKHVGRWKDDPDEVRKSDDLSG